jgi:hypothetical protein
LSSPGVGVVWGAGVPAGAGLCVSAEAGVCILAEQASVRAAQDASVIRTFAVILFPFREAPARVGGG